MAVFTDPFDALTNFQQALDTYRTSSWLDAGLSGGGAFPPLNVFRKGDDFIIIAELPGVSRRLAINQPFRPLGVELHHPITNDLERHPADLRRLRPARAFVNRGQRQKPPGLRPILRPPRGGPHHPRIKISPKWNWHGEPPALATLNQTHADSGISPSESRLLSFGIRRVPGSNT